MPVAMGGENVNTASFAGDAREMQHGEGRGAWSPVACVRPDEEGSLTVKERASQVQNRGPALEDADRWMRAARAADFYERTVGRRP